MRLLSWLFGGGEEYGRSGQWPRVRRDHLKREPACAACGSADDVEVHHIVPYHKDPSLELIDSNLVSLCRAQCHFVFGHMLHWKRDNPHVREDAARYRKRLEECSRNGAG